MIKIIKDDSTLKEAEMQARNVRRHIDRLTEAAYGISFSEMLRLAAEGRKKKEENELGQEQKE